jgi:hypothetical protein
MADLPFARPASEFPILKDPADHHRAVALTREEFHHAFTATMSLEESRAVYDRYAIPAPGRVLLQEAFANVGPHAPTPAGRRMSDYKEVTGRSRFVLGQDGWEAVADAALDWAVEHARARTVTPA